MENLYAMVIDRIDHSETKTFVFCANNYFEAQERAEKELEFQNQINKDWELRSVEWKNKNDLLTGKLVFVGASY